MPATIRLKGFLGTLPAMNPHYLPDTNAQVALNSRMWSGSLRPVNGLRAVVATTTPTKPKSIFKFDSTYWLEFTEDADFTRSPVPNDTHGRVYFTRASDGPWLTSSALVASGGPPYPGSKYRIGVPEPTAAPTTALGAGVLTGTFFYVFTVVNIYGEESPPSPVSASVTAAAQNVTVTMTAPAFGSYAPFSKFRLYRTNSLGSAFQFVSESATSPIVDNKVTLAEELPSTDWDPPPTDIKGLIMLPNGVLVAFRGNEVLMSEPGLPHAWPATYRAQTDFPIVALAPVEGGFAALTTGEPYLFTGSHPASMVPIKLKNSYACVSKRGVARFGDSAVYPSASGLVLVSSAGAQLLTEKVFDEADWAALKASTFEAFNWRGRYVAFYTDASDVLRGIMFDPASPESGVMSFYGLDFGAAYEDFGTALVYIATSSHITLWDSGDPQPYQWRSKPYEIPQPIAMRVVDVMAEAYPITVSVYRDGVLQDKVRVGGRGPHRLRNPRLGRVYEVEISGSSEVREAVVSSTMSAVRQV